MKKYSTALQELRVRVEPYLVGDIQVLEGEFTSRHPYRKWVLHFINVEALDMFREYLETNFYGVEQMYTNRVSLVVDLVSPKIELSEYAKYVSWMQNRYYTDKLGGRVIVVVDSRQVVLGQPWPEARGVWVDTLWELCVTEKLSEGTVDVRKEECWYLVFSTKEATSNRIAREWGNRIPGIEVEGGKGELAVPFCLAKTHPAGEILKLRESIFDLYPGERFDPNGPWTVAVRMDGGPVLGFSPPDPEASALENLGRVARKVRYI